MPRKHTRVTFIKTINGAPFWRVTLDRIDTRRVIHPQPRLYDLLRFPSTLHASKYADRRLPDAHAIYFGGVAACVRDEMALCSRPRVTKARSLADEAVKRPKMATYRVSYLRRRASIGKNTDNLSEISAVLNYRTISRAA